MKSLLWAVVFALASTASAFAQTAKDDPVAAVVNGEKIYRSEVMMVVDSLPEQYKQLPAAALYPQIIQRLVDRKLLAQAAKKAGYLDKPEVKRRIEIDQEQVLQEAYLYGRIDEALTDQRLKAAYDKKLAGAAKEEEVRARHVLLKSEDDAKQVIVELEKGSDFAKLATERSAGPTSGTGGDLGFFKREQMVAPFAEAAFALKKGEYTKKPVQTQFGWHVIKVEDRRVAKVPSFEDAKDELKEQEAKSVVGEIMAAVRNGAEITVMPSDATPAPGGIVPLR